MGEEELLDDRTEDLDDLQRTPEADGEAEVYGRPPVGDSNEQGAEDHGAEPHDGATGGNAHKLSRDDLTSTVYVGSLPWDVDQAKLKEFFEQQVGVGAIAEVKVITDFTTGRSKGYGFVKFADDADVDRAIQLLDNAPYGGRTLRVNRAVGMKAFARRDRERERDREHDRDGESPRFGGGRGERFGGRGGRGGPGRGRGAYLDRRDSFERSLRQPPPPRRDDRYDDRHDDFRPPPEPRRRDQDYYEDRGPPPEPRYREYDDRREYYRRPPPPAEPRYHDDRREPSYYEERARPAYREREPAWEHGGQYGAQPGQPRERYAPRQRPPADDYAGPPGYAAPAESGGYYEAAAPVQPQINFRTAPLSAQPQYAEQPADERYQREPAAYQAAPQYTSAYEQPRAQQGQYGASDDAFGGPGYTSHSAPAGGGNTLAGHEYHSERYAPRQQQHERASYVPAGGAYTRGRAHH